MYNFIMNNAELTKETLFLALKNEENTTVNEVIKLTSFKLLGSVNVDLYIYTTKVFADKILRKNILNIKNAVFTIYSKKVRDVYLNNSLIDNSILVELSAKKDIETINADSVFHDKTNEISGENNIIKSIFSYETSLLNKKKITLKFYNKYLGKEYSQEINTSILKGITKYFKRKRLIKKIKSLLELKYKPNTNDTKELVELLHLN